MVQRKSILITGATSGIGLALAQLYASEAKKRGDQIFLALTGRNERNLEEIAIFCRSVGAKVSDGILTVFMLHF